MARRRAPTRRGACRGSRPYGGGPCDGCAGSGFASEDEPSASVFCPWCVGSGLEEYAPGAAAPLPPVLAARHAAYVERLRARLGSAPLAVVA